MIHKKSFKRRYIDLLILLAILALYGINIYSLASIDKNPPTWDEAVHLRDSLIFYNILRNPSQISLSVVREIINWSEQYPLIRPSGYYPPLVPIITSLLYPIFGTSSIVAIMSNMIFISVLVFSVYGLGSTMFNRNVGLLASILIMLSPIVLQYSIIYMLDVPLIAIVAFSIYILLKSNRFSNTLFSIIFGASFGLGMLTKWTYPFFVIGPICYTVFKALCPSSSKIELGERLRLRRFRNIILFIITSIIIFGPYYFPIISILIEKTLRYSKMRNPLGPQSLFSIYSVIFYPLALWKYMLTPPGVFLFVIGMILLSLSKSSYKNFLWVWTLVPYCIFTFMIGNKIPKHMMPWLLSICLTSSFAIGNNKNIKLRETLSTLKKSIIILLLISVAVFFSLENWKLRKSIINSSKENWRINEIVTTIEEDMMKRGRDYAKKPLYLGVIPDHYYINGQTISYYFTLRWIPINVIKLENYRGTAYQEFVDKFDRYDYILTKSFFNTMTPSFQKSVDDMHSHLYSHIDLFEHMKTFLEPDSSYVSIFKRL